MNDRKHYRSIFISDIHLGFKHNRSDLANDFLKRHSCDNLYLVGDIVDVWALERKFTWSLSDSLLVRSIVNKKRHGANIYYITGNHDGALRGFLKHIDVEGVKLCNEVIHIGVDNTKYLVTHGDIFDSNTSTWIILSKLGSRVYDASIVLNTWINRFLSKIGLEPWSMSNFLKQKVKSASKYIQRYEEHMLDYCARGNYDGVICGHIHKAEIREISGLTYMNCGDWVESCTALVEHTDGKFEIITWSKLGGQD